MRFVLFGFAIAATASLSVARAADSPAPTAAGGEEKACFWTRQVRNYTNDGQRMIYLSVADRNVWRIETNGACLNAASASDPIRFTESAASGRVCTAIDVDVQVRTSRCIVTGLTKLTPEEVAALPSRLRPTNNLSIRPARSTTIGGPSQVTPDSLLASHGISTGAFGPRVGGP
jgi:hypothetical protein